MIISASRRTDIPAFYSDWFLQRIKEEYLYVKNPMNTHQVSKINLSPNFVDCIVFWTKNPSPMIDKIEALNNYSYYFQITVTGYGKDVEPGVPDKNKVVLPEFIRLSKKIGKEKTIWRYDPILISDKYTEEYHLRAFQKIAEKLCGYTERVVISFVDLYTKTQRNMKELIIIEQNNDQILEMASKLSRIARENNMTIESCAEVIDLSSVGVEHGCCIDKKLIEKIIGCPIKGKKDKNQRAECGCFESVEIGTYNTCRNGCKYCYANFNDSEVKRQVDLYDPKSPILCAIIDTDSGDKINERKVESLREDQISMF